MSAKEYPKTHSESNHLYQCRATYYNPVNCKWLKGAFTLQRNYFEFSTEESEYNTQFHLSLPLRMISSIKKRNSCLIYPSLVIEVGSEAHWFSSFPSRDSLYNLLELFWRNMLLTHTQNSAISEQVDSKIVSPLGKRLLTILHESEETLVNTANMLDEQGQQLQEVQQYVTDFDSDLTVAEKILHTLPFFPSTSQTASDGTSSNDQKKVVYIRKKKYKVTFANCGELQQNANDWEKGFLVVSDDLKLLDDEENLKFHIPIKGLLSIMIISPWELCITQDCSGKINSYNVMCPTLSQLHKVLTSSPVFQEKILYKDDCEDTFLACSSRSSMSTASDTGSVSSPVNSDASLLTDQTQNKTQFSISDEEVQQISAVLNNLQALATEVAKERECQMEKISQLIHDVDKSEISTDSHNRDMRKLQ